MTDAVHLLKRSERTGMGTARLLMFCGSYDSLTSKRHTLYLTEITCDDCRAAAIAYLKGES